VFIAKQLVTLPQMKIMEIDGANKRFWGMIVENGKKYTQTVEQDFSLTMACLENKTGSPNQFVQLMLQYDNTDFLLCTLQHGKMLQQPLDMSFAMGEELTFSINGPGMIHLTGYLLDNPEEEQDDYDMDPDFDGEAEDVSDEDEPELVPAGNKRRGEEIKADIAKKLKMLNGDYGDESGSDDDEDDSDEDIDDEDEEDEEDFSDDFEGNSFMDDEAEESEEESEEEAVVVTPSKKKNKADKKTPEQNKKTPEQNKKTPKSSPKEEKKTPEPAKEEGDAEPEAKKKKKKKKKNKKEKMEGTVGIPKQNGVKPEAESVDAKSPKSSLPKKRVAPGGTLIEELKLGHGPEAKSGKMCGMYYAGTLQKSGKRFDSCLGGKPFKFRLGKGEVIKGWDAGVQGMKVGGKRRLTVPANQAYGNRKVDVIPASSTLVFEVELKSVG